MTEAIETAKATKTKFDILNRFSGEVQFTAEIECPADAPPSVKIGLAVKWAVKEKANLSWANLSGANLSGADLSEADISGANLSGADISGAYLSEANLSEANLSGAYLSGANLSRADLSEANLSRADLSEANLSEANLSRANLIDGGQRSDGFRFVGWSKNGILQIRAGCRDFDITNARKHWEDTRKGTPLGDETTAILDHIETVARIRGIVN